jgi:hypothetical protein
MTVVCILLNHRSLVKYEELKIGSTSSIHHILTIEGMEIMIEKTADSNNLLILERLHELQGDL